MTDDRLERALSDAIADLAGHSPPAYLDDILERTSRTRQRPWWTFPRRYLAMTPSLKFATAATLAFILGIGIAPLILPGGDGTQPGPAAAESPQPSTVPEAETKPSFFTGTATSGTNLEPGEISFDGGAIRYRGMVYGNHELTASDPRISGTSFTSNNWDEFSRGAVGEESSDGSIGTAVDRIENEDGAWQGVLTGLTVDRRSVSSGWYEGEGAYEGLYAFIIWEGAGPASPSFIGIITADGPVETPEAP